MKRTVILLITVFIFSFGCGKETDRTQATQATQQSISENAVWRTPTGYVIPYSEKDHWEQYIKENTSPEKVADAKRYVSQYCVTGGTNCALECVQTTNRYHDCIKESACAPCANCGCTPKI